MKDKCFEKLLNYVFLKYLHFYFNENPVTVMNKSVLIMNRYLEIHVLEVKIVLLHWNTDVSAIV